MRARIHRTGDVLQGSGYTLAAYVESHEAGSPAVQADITSIVAYHYLATDPDTIINSATLTVADVIFDTLQLDDLWEDIDEIGYNFKWSVPAAWTASSEGLYRTQFLFTPVVGEVFYIACQTLVLKVFPIV